MGYENRNTFLFGTEERMVELPYPQRGMGATPEGWSTGSSFLNGGAFLRSSLDSHKTYDMTWSDSTSPEVAQKLKSFYDGSYGRGVLHFVDPATYLGNVLPPRWADPSMRAGLEGRAPRPFMRGGDLVPSSRPPSEGVPLNGVHYEWNTLGMGGSAATVLPEIGRGGYCFVPIPRGKSLLLGGSRSGTVAYWAAPVLGSGAVGAPVRVPDVSDSPLGGRYVVSPVPGISGNSYPTQPGVVIFVAAQGISSPSASGNLFELCGRLVPQEWLLEPRYSAKLEETRTRPWVGGMGASGLKFQGPPTWTTRSAAFGGQVSTSASLIEVGDWVHD